MLLAMMGQKNRTYPRNNRDGHTNRIGIEDEVCLKNIGDKYNKAFDSHYNS